MDLASEIGHRPLRERFGAHAQMVPRRVWVYGLITGARFFSEAGSEPLRSDRLPRNTRIKLHGENRRDRQAHRDRHGAMTLVGQIQPEIE